MSGGHFNYDQYKIRYIADEIEQIILNNGKKRDPRKLWEDEYHYAYPPEVLANLKKGWELIRKSEIYAQRIDWLVSGDDGENSFMKRLDEDLRNLEKEISTKFE